MATKLLGSLSEGLVFVLSAPAGTGKTTLVQMLCAEFPCVVQSISCTTRKPREDEVPGEHYEFLSEQKFEERIAKDEFLEYVRLYGHYYGTSRQWVVEQQRAGKHVFLVIDTQGATQLRERFGATFIFLAPPSLEELQLRLQKRQTETQEMVERRLEWAEKEIDMAHDYDYLIINDDLQTAYEVLRSIVIAEEHKVQTS